MKKLFGAVLCCAVFINCFSQQKNKEWKVSAPFDQNCFIQNDGQVKLNGKFASEKIDFHFRRNGLDYFFTSHGYIVRKYIHVKNSEKEIENLRKKLGIKEEKDGKEEKEFAYRMEEQFFVFNFDNNEPNVQIETSDLQKEYFVFPDPKNPKKNTSITAKAFGKIVYKNIYPNTDLIFEIPKGKEGIKYSFRINGPADISKISMSFSSGSDFEIKENGNAEIKSPFGIFTDHAPETFLQNGKIKLKSNFVRKENKIRFNVEGWNGKDAMLIDPWTASPAMVNVNKAYDVEYDVAGNVYVCGGTYPYQVKKYSPAGTALWSFSCSGFTPYSGTAAFYGDFAIDKTTGRAYVTEGFNGSGAMVIKLSSSGTLLTTFPGNPNYTEMWRIAFSRCTNQAVIVGGGVSSPTYHGCHLDTNLTSLVPVTLNNTGNTGEDIACLALDNFGYGYIIGTTDGFSTGILSNSFVKITLPGLLPLQYNVTSGYTVKEINSYFVAPTISNYSFANGINGITCSGTRVFTYDSYVIRKRDGANGNMLIYKRINTPPGNDSSLISFSGITSDDCGNVFAADYTDILQFDSLLNPVTTITGTDTIYDVKLGSNGALYVCGANFVAAKSVNVSGCNSGVLSASLSVTQSGCNTTGSATVNISGGVSPYTIQWSTNPIQTGTTVSNLNPGTYTISVSDDACVPNLFTDTFTIVAGPGAFATNATVTQILCYGQTNGSIVLSETGGVNPFTYTWVNAGLSGNSATGLAPGSYSVSVTDNAGCTNNNLVYVIASPPDSLQNTISLSGTANCGGDTLSVTVNVAGGTWPYTINWTNPASQTGNVIHGVGPGNYNGVITDGNGCQKNFSVNIPSASMMSANVTSNFNCAVLNSGSLAINVSGGVSPYSYQWQTAPLQFTQTATNLASGTYSVIVTDGAGCQQTFSGTVPAFSPVSISFSASQPCNSGSNGSIQSTVSGGTGTPVYSWSTNPAQTTSGINNVAAGVYTLSVTSGACNSSQTYTLTEDAAPDTLVYSATYCSGDLSSAYTAPAGGGISGPYQWYQSGVAIPGATGQQYTGTVQPSGVYSVSWFLNGCKFITTADNLTVFPANVSVKPTNIFSPNNDNLNELFFPFETIYLAGLTAGTEEYEINVYDRWGILLFNSTDISKGWDGKTNGGTAAPAGTYFWMSRIKLKCPTSTEQTFKGFVQLIK